MDTIPKFMKGQALKADDLNRIVVAVNGGPRVANEVQASESIWAGKASGTITARSGTTPGAGTVRVYIYDGSAMVDSGLDIAVLNFSAASGGIASTTWCSIGRDGNGVWFVLSAECTS